MPKHEWPSFDEKPVKKYQPEELAKLFKAANEREWLLFQFFLGSGGREGEVARLKWADIDFKDKKVLFVSQPRLCQEKTKRSELCRKELRNEYVFACK